MTRAEAIKYLKEMKDGCNDTFHKVRYVTKEETLDMAIKVLEQEPKTGHWIDSSNGWMCSECNKDNTFDTNYCPNCGCRMVEPQESEDT